MTFAEVQLRPQTIKALKEEGITTPTEIQRETIPLIKEGKDVIGISHTGSGKTLAFAAPIIEQVDPAKGLQVIVLVPTRELAVQIAEEFRKFGKYERLSVLAVYGGVSLQPQINALRKTHILVATPGRTLDHLQRQTLRLDKIRCVVIDEADKMVDMGFIDDINRILSYTPKQKQVVLFGATIGGEVKDLRKRHMHNPMTIKAELHVENNLLKQYYYNVLHNEKFSLLVHLLNKERQGRTIIFCSARSTVELLAKNLKRQGIKTEHIHGQIAQNKRLQAIERINKDKSDILVASAVAARGLHISDVTQVINYDLSNDAEEYIHRVGRTARAGEPGKAITLLSQKDHPTFNQIIVRFGIDVELLPPEHFEKVSFDAGRSRTFSRQRGGYGQQSRGGSYRGQQSRGSPRGSSSRGPSSGGFSRGNGQRSSSRGGSQGRRNMARRHE